MLLAAAVRHVSFCFCPHGEDASDCHAPASGETAAMAADHVCADWRLAEVDQAAPVAPSVAPSAAATGGPAAAPGRRTPDRLRIDIAPPDTTAPPALPVLHRYSCRHLRS